MFVIKYKKIFFMFSGILVTTSLVVTFVQGLNIGIDFTGGSAVEVKYAEGRPDISVVKQTIEDVGIDVASIRSIGESSFMFQLKSTDSEIHDAIIIALEELDPEAVLEMADPHIVGPSIGAELRSKAWIAIVTVAIAIILFIAYVFRSASEKVSSWNYGVVAIIALVHDIIIPTGVVAAFNMEVSSLFVIALLAILGLSVNDTIVVLDRVRENIKLKASRDFSEIVGKSLEQTFSRSISTSLTTLFVVVTLFFMGPETTKDFAFILAIGLAVGTYSSIFLASPLLVEAEKIQRKHGRGK